MCVCVCAYEAFVHVFNMCVFVFCFDDFRQWERKKKLQQLPDCAERERETGRVRDGNEMEKEDASAGG